FQVHHLHDAPVAWTILDPALSAMQTQGYVPGPEFTLLAFHCANRLGKTAIGVRWLERGMAAPDVDPIGRAQITGIHAEATLAQHDPLWALERLRQAAHLFESAGDWRSKAVTMGKIADVLQQRGEIEEALRIRREEELPVYERLGDVQAKAVTMGRI